MKTKSSHILILAVSSLLIVGMIGLSFVKHPAIQPLPLNSQMSVDRPAEETGTRVTQEMLDLMNHEIDALRSTTLDEMQSLHKKNTARIETIVKKHRGGVWQAASSAAAPFQGFKNTGHTGILSAIDLATAQAERANISNIKSSNHLETYTHNAMKPVILLVERATLDITSEIEAHLAEVDALRNRYRMNTLRVIERHGLSAAVLEEAGVVGLVPAYKEIVSAVDRNRSATLSTAVEAAVIAYTYKIIKRVLIHIARKLSSTATVAITSAAADGPLPIGDIIGAVVAAGGLTWAAYDVHQAVKQQRELPGKIDKQIQRTLTQIQRTALGIVRDSCKPTHIPQARMAFSSNPSSDS